MLSVNFVTAVIEAGKKTAHPNPGVPKHACGVVPVAVTFPKSM